jgi:hypothetical protein
MGRQLAVRLFREFARDDADSVLSIESLTSEILAASARFNAIAGYASEPHWVAHARELLDTAFANL